MKVIKHHIHFPTVNWIYDKETGFILPDINNYKCRKCNKIYKI